MHIIAIASQKGGAGKSTFAANLAALADEPGAPAVLIDTDAQASLSVWRSIRRARSPVVVPCHVEDLSEILATVRQHGGVEWVFIDGPPQNNNEIAAVMRVATLVVIPSRPNIFDLASAIATIEMARKLQRPFFVALNAVPPKRGIAESPVTTTARRAIRDMSAPIWRGAVGQRAIYAQALASGEAVSELEPEGAAADEMRLLWRDVSEAARAMAAYQKAG